MDSPRTEFRSVASDEGFSFRMLLTLVIYAYARGIYGSAEMADHIASDSDLRYLAARDTPDALTLRQFRRQNWTLVRTALARLVALSSDCSESEAWFDTGAEADLRLERAAAADSYALDC